MAINQKLVFETQMTASAAFGQLWQCGNTNAQLVSASKVCFWEANSALRLSNQREIKTVHGRLIKVSMRTCETLSLLAEQKYKLLKWRRRHLGRTDKTWDKCFPPTIQNNGLGGDGRIRLLNADECFRFDAAVLSLNHTRCLAIVSSLARKILFGPANKQWKVNFGEYLILVSVLAEELRFE